MPNAPGMLASYFVILPSIPVAVKRLCKSSGPIKLASLAPTGLFARLGIPVYIARRRIQYNEMNSYR